MRNWDNYVVKDKFLKQKRRNRASVCWGCGLSAFCLLTIVLAITDEELAQDMSLYVVCLILSLLVWLNGIRKGKIVKMVNRYNAIFKDDRDGYVTLSELEKRTGKKPEVIVSEIEHLLESGYLCNCTLVKQGKPMVVLNDGKQGETGFVQVRCAACGGVTRMRVGRNGRCEYCDSRIKA